MVREFKLPDVGEGLAEAEIVDWLVEVGDTVTEDQPVAEVETDKAVVEVPSPVNGTVREIRAEAGELVPVGEVIITFDVEGEEPEPVETDAAESAGAADADDDVEAVDETDDTGDPEGTAQRGGRTFAAPSARRLARELGVDIGAVSGSGPGGRVTEQDVRAHAEGGRAAQAATDAEADEGADEPEPTVQSATRKVTDDAEPATGAASVEAAGRDRTLAAPATRKLADDEGVALDDVPTDETRDGEAFVTPEQVREYVEGVRTERADTHAEAQEADAEAVQAETDETTAETEATAEGEVERIPYRGVRRTIGNAMERSKYTAPHVTHHEEVVVEELVQTRERLKPTAEARDSKLTYMPFVVKAVVAALKQHPILNSQLDEEAEEILVKQYYNVGIAVATDAGLMVPVVKDADEKDMLTLADEVRDLAGRARDRSIAREEMQDGTFSITNFGAIGGDYATPIINYPETAILGLGALKQRPVVEDSGASETPRASGEAANGEVVARHTLPLSLSIDHRVVDGADAARFVSTLAEYLENPELLLLE